MPPSTRATRRVVVTVAEGANAVVVSVRDDGPGFATEDQHEGFGLIGVRERVELVGGTLSVQSGPGAGPRSRRRCPCAGARARRGRASASPSWTRVTRCASRRGSAGAPRARRRGGAEDAHPHGEHEEDRELADRDAKPKPRSLSATVVSHAKSDADRRAEQAADDRGDDALVADHAPHLVRRGADGAQQAELARALVDRQEQAVGDSEQRDHDAHRQQRVEQVDDLVELVADVVAGTRRLVRTLSRRERRSAALIARLDRVEVGPGVDRHEAGERVARAETSRNCGTSTIDALQQLRVAVLADRRQRARGRRSAPVTRKRRRPWRWWALANCSSIEGVRRAPRRCRVGVACRRSHVEAVDVAERARVDRRSSASVDGVELAPLTWSWSRYWRRGGHAAGPIDRGPAARGERLKPSAVTTSWARHEVVDGCR